VPAPGAPPAAGSIIAVVATDAPLLPTQCDRLAQRAGLGVARAGGLGENFSGDLFVCFSTANRGLPPNTYDADAPRTVDVRMTANRWISGLFQAVVEATEEAIVNALLAAETMSGYRGVTAYALEPDRLLAALRDPR
jgi:D-aminopeptidase